MSHENTTPAGAAGHTKAPKVDPIAELAARFDAFAARISAKLDHLRDLLDEQNAMMLVLLPEQMIALTDEEVLALAKDAPDTALVLVHDFHSTMTSMAKGEVLLAGDPRVRLYARASTFQVAIVRKRPGSSGVDLQDLVRRRNELDVRSRIETERVAAQAEADRLRKLADQAEAAAAQKGTAA